MPQENHKNGDSTEVHQRPSLLNQVKQTLLQNYLYVEPGIICNVRLFYSQFGGQSRLVDFPKISVLAIFLSLYANAIRSILQFWEYVLLEFLCFVEFLPEFYQMKIQFWHRVFPENFSF